MDVQHPPPQLDLPGGVLLLGVLGDVHLLDCRQTPLPQIGHEVTVAAGSVPVGVRVSDPALIPAAVAAGAALVHIDSRLGSAVEVYGATRAGAMVVLAGDPAVSRERADELLEQGARAGQLVVEWSVSDDGVPPDPTVAHRLEADGIGLGAALRPGSGPVDEVVGWQIGMLTHLTGIGARTVRNISEVRFRRVQAVLAAIGAAKVASGSSQPSSTSVPTTYRSDES